MIIPFLLLTLGSSCTAFSPGPSPDCWNVVSTRQHRTDITNRRRSNNPQRSPTEQLRSNQNDDNDAIGAEKGAVSGANGGDLVKALARLDKKWQLSYNSKDGETRNRNDWQVVNVANENGDDKNNNDSFIVGNSLPPRTSIWCNAIMYHLLSRWGCAWTIPSHCILYLL